MAHTDPFGEPSAEDDPDADTPDLTSYCPPNGLIDTLRTKYAIGIVVHLGESGELRYGELKDRVGAPGVGTE